MKTAVSVPDDVYNRAEALARHLRLNRSQLYAKALAEFVSKHAPDDVTDALDRVCDAVADESDGFTQAAATSTLQRSDW